MTITPPVLDDPADTREQDGPSRPEPLPDVPDVDDLAFDQPPSDRACSTDPGGPPPPAEPPDDGDGDDGDGGPVRWVTIATFWLAPQAHIVRLRLESEDIPVLLLDENQSALGGFYANIIGGIKLQVPEEDEARARELLVTEPDSHDGGEQD